jgi:hypothetical protein
MPFKKHNPGCPCCDGPDCMIADYAFDSSGELASFDQEEGDWSIDGGNLQTEDAAAVIRSLDATPYVEQVATVEYLPDAVGDSVIIRFGWNVTEGNWLWAKYTAGEIVDGSGCGSLELGIHTDADGDRILQGPWKVLGGDFGSAKQLRVCYDGQDATFRFRSNDVTRDILLARNFIDFAHPEGKSIGIETGQAGDYKFASLKIEQVGGVCPECDACHQIEDNFPMDYEEDDVYYYSCRWKPIVSGWAQVQEPVSSADTHIITSTTGATIELDKVYRSWTQDRVFEIDLYRENFEWPYDVPKVYFWYVDANNHFYVEVDDAFFYLFRVVDGVLSEFDVIASGQPGSVVRVTLYLSKHILGIAQEGGTKEYFYNAPSEPSTIRIEAYSVQSGGFLRVDRVEEYCETPDRTCGGCQEELVSEGLPERMEIVVEDCTEDSRINGTYIARLVNRQSWRCQIVDADANLCLWRVINMPDTFIEMMLLTAKSTISSGAVIWFVTQAQKKAEEPPGAYGWSYRLEESIELFECAAIEEKSLSPMSGFLSVCRTPYTSDSDTAGTCHVTALENQL